MTKASLSALAEGHGLVDSILDAHYASYNKGEPIREVVALVVLRPIGIAATTTKQGRHNVVKYEVAKAEPVLDADRSSDFRYIVQALYEARTTPGDNALPLGLPGFDDEEKRKAILERIETWATEQEMTGGELDEAWRNHFGIGAGEENSWGDRGVPSEYGRSPMTWLLEFALEKGAVDGEKPDEVPGVEFSHAADGLEVEDDDPLATEGSDDATGDE